MPEQLSKDTKVSSPRTRKTSSAKSTVSFPVDQGINLIPQDKQAKAESTQRIVMGHILASVFIALALVAVSYGSLYIYGYTKEQELSQIKQDRAAIDQSIGVLEAHRNELTQFQGTLEKVKGLLSNHIRWTNFFTLLEKYTSPDVTYTNVVVSPQGNVRLSGIAKDYTVLAKQLKAFEAADSAFSQATITSGHSILSQTGSTIGVSFDAALTVKPEVLTSITQ